MQAFTLVFLFQLILVLDAKMHYHVKVWQPPINTSNITEPVRFWELVEWRPVQEEDPTTTTTTTTTTTPSTTTTTVTTTTTTTPPPPTPPPCDVSDPEVLLKRMKDSGVYNDIYMAPDFLTASEMFPDLSGRHFMRPKSKYSCDEHCERSSQLVRLVMTGQEPRPTPPDTPRAWWDPAKWEQNGREKRSIRASPDPTARRRELQATIRSALRELEELGEEDTPDNTSLVDSSDSYDEFFSSNLPGVKIHKRERRSKVGDIMHSNSGSAKDIIGTTIALECKEEQEAGKLSKAGYQFCKTCRAVRHLPKSYFPRILNEVICAESSCVRGDGRCAQRFLPFKVLHNEGNDECPKWRLVSIDIRTCCDCVVHPYSPFVRYLQAN